MQNEDREAVSILEFCKIYGISVSLFYKLRGEGRAPKTLKVGNRCLITKKAAATWLNSLEQSA